MNQYETVHDIIADRERLRAEIERLRVVHRETLADVMKRMRAERDALRADAERYRWLASRAHKDTARDRYGSGAHWRIGFFADDGRHAFDAAIDAAREAK